MLGNENLKKKLVLGAADLGIRISDSQADKCLILMNELLIWNEKMNLTTIVEQEDVITKHFLDSMGAVQLVPKNASRLLDVGSGGGFPGIPLKICLPSLQVVLMDSTKKKIEFLAHVIRILGVSIDVLHMRAEDAGKSDDLRESYDVVVSRAVADLSVLSEYCLPLTALGGVFIAMKAQGVQDELARAQRAIETLGGGEVSVVDYRIPGTDIERTCVLIQKISSTPGRFPRKAGIPAKRPLND